MPQTLPKQKEVYTIGEAAQTLGVAIDTLRRWEKIGKVKADRSSGGIRLFSKLEIEKLIPYTKKQAHYLSVSQAANYLDVSPGTLRRWDRQDRLKPFRTLSNERVYSPEQLEEFVRTTPPTDQAEVTDPVGFIKEKVEELSDTVLISIIDKSALEHYRFKLLSTAAVVLLFAAATMVVTLPHNQNPVADMAGGTVLPADAQLSGQQKIGTSEVFLPNDIGYVQTGPSNNGIESISADGSTIVLHTNSIGTIIRNSSPSQFTAVQKPTLPTGISIITTQQSNPTDANFNAKTDAGSVGQTANGQAENLNLVPSPLFTSGSASIVAGNNSVFVADPSVTASSKVFLSQTGSSIGTILVNQKLPGRGFTVETAKSTTAVTMFDWLVVE